jgi:hypothetical protein
MNPFLDDEPEDCSATTGTFAMPINTTTCTTESMPINSSRTSTGKIDWSLRPPLYTKGQNIDVWWKRFAQIIEENAMPEKDMHRVLMRLLSDECMDMVEYNVPEEADAARLRKFVFELFRADDPRFVDREDELFGQKQKPDEDVRKFLTELWKLKQATYILHPQST